MIYVLFTVIHVIGACVAYLLFRRLMRLEAPPWTHGGRLVGIVLSVTMWPCLLPVLGTMLLCFRLDLDEREARW